MSALRCVLSQALLLAFADIFGTILPFVSICRGGGCTCRCIAMRAAGGSRTFAATVPLGSKSQRGRQHKAGNHESFSHVLGPPFLSMTLASRRVDTPFVNFVIKFA